MRYLSALCTDPAGNCKSVRVMLRQIYPYNSVWAAGAPVEQYTLLVFAVCLIMMRARTQLRQTRWCFYTADLVSLGESCQPMTGVILVFVE